MKTVSAGYETYVETATSRRDWRFIKLERTDGEVFGFTNGDREREIEGVTYVPGFKPFAVQTGTDMQPGNTSADGGLSSAGITEEDIKAGRWDFAYWEYFTAKWDNLALGTEPELSGYLGTISRGRTRFETELNDLFALFNQQIGRLIQAPCDDDLGGPRCKVRLDPPAWAALTGYTVRPPAEAALGSVVKPSTPNNRHFKCSTAGTSGASEPAWNTTIGGTTNDGSVVWTTIQALTVYGTIDSVTSGQLEFRDSTRTEAGQFFAKITMTSGANEGLSEDIKVYAANGTIALQLPFPFDVEVGDTYEMTARCGKSLADCKTLFDNVNNHQGFPHVTGNDYIMSGKVGEAA